MLKIALSKGALYEESVQLFKQIGVIIAPPKDGELESFDKKKQFRFYLVRPMDVPVYVEHGGADLGIAGKDVLAEGGESVAELVDLGIGKCRLVLAVPEELPYKTSTSLSRSARIATKYPKLTGEYFARLDHPIEVVKLYGSVELAPRAGLAEGVVDLTATGKTLKKNRLRILDTLLESSARLIANRMSYKSRYAEIQEWAGKLAKQACLPARQV